MQTVKRSLRKILFRASVNYEELQTVVVEVEAIINSRPLTYMYDDDVEEILTPSHLVLGRRLLSKFDEGFEDDTDVDNAVLTKRMKYLKTLSNHFWKRFKDEYLLDLRSHHIQGSDHRRTAEVGEVVVVEGKSKRNQWRLGKITMLITGKDGRSRAAVVKTFDGEKERYIKRPIERLYPIEVKSKLEVTKDEIDKSISVAESKCPTNPSSVVRSSSFPDQINRPTRIAAENGILMRRLAGH